MSRLHHLGRFTLDFLAAEAKEGYSLSYIVLFCFLFSNKRRHTNSSVETIYFTGMKPKQTFTGHISLSTEH